MPPLLTANDLTKSFGVSPLFQNISLAIEDNETIGLIGPNGSGKSTLLKMLAGMEEPDEGKIQSRRDLRPSYIPQEENFDPTRTVEEILIPAASTYDLVLSDQEIQKRVNTTLGKAGFADGSPIVGNLSGGWKKRLAIVRGLIAQPDLLLIDEPTNHLDIESIEWLENLFYKAPFASIVISHDRFFLEKVADRIIEIDKRYPNGFFEFKGKYSDFLEARENLWSNLHQERASLANKVRREVAWLRQGAKARSTKSKHRIAEAGKMIDTLSNFKLQDNKVDIEFAATNRKSRDLIKAEHLAKSLGGKTLFKDITITISPKTRLGIAGLNGSGKTSFVKTLIGTLKQDSGKIIRANQLQVAFLDQARTQLDPTMTLKMTLCPDGDGVVFNGRQIHIAAWAERFLFPRDKLSIPVSSLSGGERARLLLAKIMLSPADILILDEPTNDLDINTLEILEDSLLEFPGAIILVTHDRYMLDSVATSLVAISGEDSGVYGDYSQWDDERRTKPKKKAPKAAAAVEKSEEDVPVKKAVPTKLSYNEQRELDTIEAKILKAEGLVTALQAEIQKDDVQADGYLMIKKCEELSEQEKLVSTYYARWAELDELKRLIKEAKGS